MAYYSIELVWVFYYGVASAVLVNCSQDSRVPLSEALIVSFYRMEARSHREITLNLPGKYLQILSPGQAR
jgi:hypothetical protein